MFPDVFLTRVLFWKRIRKESHRKSENEGIMGPCSLTENLGFLYMLQFLSFWSVMEFFSSLFAIHHVRVERICWWWQYNLRQLIKEREPQPCKREMLEKIALCWALVGKEGWYHMCLYYINMLCSALVLKRLMLWLNCKCMFPHWEREVKSIWVLD